MIMITILSLTIIIIVIAMILFSPNSDPLFISTPAKHEVSYALETPGSLYRPSESSSDSEEPDQVEINRTSFLLGIWRRIELNDSTFLKQNKWSMLLLERLHHKMLKDSKYP